MVLSERLTKMRNDHKLSQEACAKQFGVTVQMIELWEGGKEIPDLKIVIEMSKFYHVSTDYILMGKSSEFVFLIYKKLIFPLLCLALFSFIVIPISAKIHQYLDIKNTGTAFTYWTDYLIHPPLSYSIAIIVIMALATVLIFLYSMCRGKNK